MRDSIRILLVIILCAIAGTTQTSHIHIVNQYIFILYRHQNNSRPTNVSTLIVSGGSSTMPHFAYIAGTEFNLRIMIAAYDKRTILGFHISYHEELLVHSRIALDNTYVLLFWTGSKWIFCFRHKQKLVSFFLSFDDTKSVQERHYANPRRIPRLHFGFFQII